MSESGINRWIDAKVRIDLEVLVYVLLILLAVLTRFYDLDTRVMSHDESLHTWFSWQLTQGRGYAHDPMMHGPLQFHLVSLSYFLFGDSDATSRIPAALAGVLAVGMIFLFRRWLGRWGGLVATALMVISPYMLYYSRYVRNEALVVPQVLLMVYAVFRYFEDRRDRWLYLLAASLALHYATKETAFIYIAQLMLFLGGYLAWRLINLNWKQTWHKVTFLIGFFSAALGTMITLYALFRERALTAEIAQATEIARFSPFVTFGLILALTGISLIGLSLIIAFGSRLREDFPALDLLLVVGTMTLPQLAALPATLLGWNPMDYHDPVSNNRTLIVVFVLMAVSIAIGLIWDWRRWLLTAGIFFGLYTVFYTTLFTNGEGMISGLVGSLGYWLQQHGVERGSQPGYYYILVQIPVYEYLPAVGALLAGFYGLIGIVPAVRRRIRNKKEKLTSFPVIGFIAYWTLTSLALYSFAGERMPWLTVHITLPMILFAGWALGKLLQSINWQELWSKRAWLIPPLLLLTLLGFSYAIGTLLGPNPPFQGTEFDQLRATSICLSSLGVAIAALVALIKIGQGWSVNYFARLSAAAVFVALTILTVRTAYRAAYVNYDQATEFMVYAHGATGNKTVMEQVHDLSLRMTDDLDIEVAFDDDVAWPLNWYLRHYSSQYFFGANPTRELLDYPIVIVGDNNWTKVEDLFSNRFNSFEYIRMWWPTQKYWDLTWDRIKGALSSPDYLSAIWDIWLNRDYAAYGELSGIDFSLGNWQPSDRMRLYVRKDIAATVWDYGVSPVSLAGLESVVDPYLDGMVDMPVGFITGEEGSLPGQFAGPRGIAVAPDGTLYVADTMNHRIQHLSQAGEVILTWGRYANLDQGEAPGGTFNEPWGIDVGPDGTVYVADTWNHRVQYFTAEGEFLGMFGIYGHSSVPDNFWGPRGVTVDDEGRVFIADTGNKRIAIFDSEGHPIGMFGDSGWTLGQFDEPVGIALGAEGRIYVADTWNQRVQVFEEITEGSFEAILEWPIAGWFGQSPDNKPFLDVSPSGEVCATDPDGYRVLCFTPEGDFLFGWGDYGDSESQFNKPSGLSFDSEGRLWLVDSKNGRLIRFNPEFR